MTIGAGNELYSIYFASLREPRKIKKDLNKWTEKTRTDFVGYTNNSKNIRSEVDQAMQLLQGLCSDAITVKDYQVTIFADSKVKAVAGDFGNVVPDNNTTCSFTDVGTVTLNDPISSSKISFGIVVGGITNNVDGTTSYNLNITIGGNSKTYTMQDSVGAIGVFPPLDLGAFKFKIDPNHCVSGTECAFNVEVGNAYTPENQISFEDRREDFMKGIAELVASLQEGVDKLREELWQFGICRDDSPFNACDRKDKGQGLRFMRSALSTVSRTLSSSGFRLKYSDDGKITSITAPGVGRQDASPEQFSVMCAKFAQNIAKPLSDLSVAKRSTETSLSNSVAKAGKKFEKEVEKKKKDSKAAELEYRKRLNLFHAASEKRMRRQYIMEM